MRFVGWAAVCGSILILTQGTAPAGATNSLASPLVADAQGPPSYTFHIDVAMTMGHFPWLHFHMQGLGEYQPGSVYVVRFTKLPWFMPSQVHDADLSMLDPSMWQKRFTYERTGEQDGDVLFSLRPISGSGFKNATVALTPNATARWLDVSYDDGSHLHMTVNCSSVDGFMLPESLTADISDGRMPLSANAAFDDYDFTPAQPQ